MTKPTAIAHSSLRSQGSLPLGLARSRRSRANVGTGRSLVALIGDPVAESASPAMQNAAFRAAGLPLEYVTRRVSRDELARVFPLLGSTHLGLNVTTPLKEAVIPLLDEVAPDALSARSVNTVVFHAGRAVGISTDGEGFLRALRRSAPELRPRTALVIGTGGAARAVIAALVRDGVEVKISGRDRTAGARLARELDAGFVAGEDLERALGEVDLLVSAVPAAAWAGPTPPLPSGATLRPPLVVFDLVYRPRRTPLLERATAAGCATVEGIEMLIEQGALSFTAWTGLDPDIPVMREAAYRAVDAPLAAGLAR